MITETKRNAIRQRIHARIRAKLSGTGERPRLNVYRSLNHIYAQVIDDQTGETLVSASTHQAEDRRQHCFGQGDWQGSGREGSRARASRRWSSIAAATCITAASRHWPMQLARQAWNFKDSYKLLAPSF